MSARSESERSCVSTEEDPMRPEGRGEDYSRMKPPLQLQQQESQQQSQQNQSQQKQSQQPLPQPKTKIEPLIQPIYVRGDAADDEDEEDDDDGEQDDEDDEEDGEEFMEADGNQKSVGVEKFMLGRDGRSKDGVDRGEKRAVTNARVRIQGRDDKRVQEDCRYIDGYDGEGVDGDEYDEVEGKRCAESFSSSAKSHTIMSSTPASMQNTKPPLRAPSASSRIRPIRNMATNSNGANQGTKKKKKKKRVKRIIGVNLTACKYQSVRRSIAAMGWKEVGEDEDWVLYWTDTSVSTERVMNLKRYQKINHFPGMIEISRKAHMARNLRRMEKFFPEEYNITPKTWILPQELGEFKKVLLKKKKRTYIIKPDAGSQGKGIYLVRRPEDLVIPESGNFMNAVAQEYLAKPLLIDGYKFDMRIYALVMSCDPLRIFLYKEGMGRFCTNPYQEPTLENLENVFMHLTNYSINKNNDKFIYTNDPESFGEGSKRTLSAMKSILEERGISWSQLWEKIGVIHDPLKICTDRVSNRFTYKISLLGCLSIFSITIFFLVCHTSRLIRFLFDQDIIIKTLICIQPMLAHVYRTCVPDGMEGSACFELLGFDIIIDSQLKPLLLEVNHSPSLSCDSGIDTYIKDNLLKSVCNLLHIDSNYMKRYQKEQKLRFQQRIFGNRKKSDEMDGIDKEDTKSKYLEIQAKWEEEHMGNFTRIYPSENSEKYDPFFSVAWSGGIGETQSNMAKKMQAQKKVEEQVKLSKPQTKISDKDRRGSERKLSERPVSARSSRLTESRTSKSREINDGLSSEKVSREIMNAQDFDEMKKLTSEIGRHKSPAPSRQSISYLVLGDNLPHSEIPGHEKVDVLGLTDAQLSDLCLNLPEDRQLQPEIQKRTRFLKGIGIREKIGQLIASMQEAQRNSKYCHFH
eukprot:TRINITY_DN4646_c0_g2_i5.p1 TRINITY_DN4646_c0_g2~~TRINITY_DN4646_c0_g2_i5.p1  ORF type:complete len:914 (-),score=170.44 TRINITY_DN4646_c0_g2_i5:137-2878(-)